MTMSRILRRPEILMIFGFSSSTLDRRRQQGLFTPPVNVCGRIVGWPEQEVSEIYSAVIRGVSAVEIKLLVHKLIKRRQEVQSEPDLR